jgi:hypothetical protein
MGSLLFALVSLAVVLVIFWSARSDQLTPDSMWGPFAPRRQGAPRPPERPVRRDSKG